MRKEDGEGNRRRSERKKKLDLTYTHTGRRCSYGKCKKNRKIKIIPLLMFLLCIFFALWPLAEVTEEV